MQIKSFFKTMKDGAKVKVNYWLCDEDVDLKGIVVLHHGLAEHSLRYDRFGSILTEGFFLVPVTIK